jgi:hypothetical protein
MEQPSDHGDFVRIVTAWLQLAVIIVGGFLAVLHLDRRITHLEDRLEEIYRQAEKLEHRLEMLEQMPR